MEHSYYSSANAIYELLIGISCFGMLFGAMIGIPILYAMYAGMKEDQERLA